MNGSIYQGQHLEKEKVSSILTYKQGSYHASSWRIDIWYRNLSRQPGQSALTAAASKVNIQEDSSVQTMGVLQHPQNKTEIRIEDIEMQAVPRFR